MRLKTLFFLLALLLIVVWGILLMLALESGKTLFYVGEGVTTLSLIVLAFSNASLWFPPTVFATGSTCLASRTSATAPLKVGKRGPTRLGPWFKAWRDRRRTEAGLF